MNKREHRREGIAMIQFVRPFMPCALRLSGFRTRSSCRRTLSLGYNISLHRGIMLDIKIIMYSRIAFDGYCQVLVYKLN